ncbi:insulinase family protein [Psychromonas algicola]|uniref:insulinase family protein n=1 Tax=Psychromonas algicola TaxID=2555642 RepID=UPI001419E5D6|nr:insulinase family protein [Psychromonas sp. RZ5]
MKISLLNIYIFTLLFSVFNCVQAASTEPEISLSLSNKNTIIKAPNDQRNYRYLELDNGLKVVLVSDSTASQSAVSMNVHVGHMDDPKDREGLSHFLEHMLFLGTVKYPKAGEYREFLTSNGGRGNARTSQQETLYYFQINQNAFEEAIDRFAQFFITPNFDSHYVEREKNAVDSEYRLKIKDEDRRIREVLKDTSNPAHPFSQFSVGNLDTLVDRDGDLLIDAVKAHYAHNYSANRMSLAIVGHEDLDTLEHWAREKFSEIPNSGSKVTKNTVNPYLAEQLAVKIKIQPLSSKKQLILSFPVPKSTPYFSEKPLAILVYLLGDESRGSLYSLLKKKGLITALNTSYSGPDDFDLFNLKFNLTFKGTKQYKKIIEAVFSYLKLLTNEQYNQQYFNEKSLIAKTKFNFKENSSSQATAIFLSSKLQTVLPANVWSSTYLYGNYSHQLHMDYLSYFTPQNMRLILLGKGLSTNLVQPEYNTSYAIAKLSAKELQRYQTPPVIKSLTYPHVNTFIATDFTLKKVEQVNKNPVVIFEEPGFKFWFKQETELRVPKSTLTVKIYSPYAGKDALSWAKNRLYIALLKSSLNEMVYPAKKAGLDYKIDYSHEGVTLSVSGYNEKTPELLSLINQALRNLSIDKDEFTRYKKNIKYSEKKSKRKYPYIQAEAILKQIQVVGLYSNKEISEAVENVTIEELTQYIKSFHQHIEVEILALGNISKSESIKLADKLYTFYMSDVSVKKRSPIIVNLNNTQHALIRELEIDHNDSVLVASYISQDNSLANRAKYELLGNMISTPFYNSIRTEQQLGYKVGAKNIRIGGFPGMYFYVQSAVVGPVELTRRIDEFINNYQFILKNMSHKQFGEYQQGLIKQLQVNNYNLITHTNYYLSEIKNKEFNFDSKAKLAAELKKLTKADMLEFYNSFITTVHPIVVRSFGKAHQSSDDYKKSQLDKSICHVDQCFKGELKAFLKY